MKEIGIYVHIPFCKSKCYYCDFASFADKDELIDRYVKAVKSEIYHRQSEDYIIKTIYIGGGTPSYIPEKYIEEILAMIENCFLVSNDAEITIEVNPGTVNKSKLSAYMNSGINRLSVGLQSANNELLKKIGRIHSLEDYEKTINLAQKVGFKNINTDIIIGLPDQTIYDVENAINKVVSLGINHISIYSLIVEENTKMEQMLNSKKYSLPDEEMERYMYWFAKRKLEDEGFNHYEISNFAKEGMQSKHNMDCWNQKEYLGFGSAAASYENKVRYKNIEAVNSYIKNIEENSLEKNLRIEEKQTEIDEMNEFMILGLRKIKGVDVIRFKNKFLKSPFKVYKEKLKKLFDEGLIFVAPNVIRLTDKGLDLANIVWEEFV